MVQLNYLIFEKNSYVNKDGKLVEFTNCYLDFVKDEYRYRIPLSCSDRGELSKVFREVKTELDGLYTLKYEVRD